MILVTGGTGFIGQALIRQLAEAGYPVRLLLHPSPNSPRLPKGMPVEVSVSSLSDPRGLRAAMVGVKTVYHLIGGEWLGVQANLLKSDIQGTQAVVSAAAETGVERFFMVSHLGADRASAYPVLKTKGIVEENIRRSGMDFTILRSSLAFGPNDHFTTNIAKTLHALPGIFIVPGDGGVLLQPIWVEDLVTCLTWALEDDTTRNQVFEVGGPEYLSLRQVAELVMHRTKTHRRIVGIPPAYMRLLTLTVDSAFPRFPVTVFWLDYLATHRTAPLDTVPRSFKLMPARLTTRANYLEGVNWGRELRRTIFQRRHR